MRILTRVAAVVTAVVAAQTASAQLNLIAIGGGPMSGNVALWSAGATPYGSSSISGYPYHKIAGINDGWYGNDGNINYGGGAGSSGASWIPTTFSAIGGVTLAGPTTIGQVAWGRDSSLTYQERTAGTYYFEVSTDGLGFFNGAKVWTTVGSVSLSDFTANDSKRHLYSFTAQTGVTDARLRIVGSGVLPVCIEELELYAPVPEPGSLAVIAAGLAFTLKVRRYDRTRLR